MYWAVKRQDISLDCGVRSFLKDIETMIFVKIMLGLFYNELQMADLQLIVETSLLNVDNLNY